MSSPGYHSQPALTPRALALTSRLLQHDNPVLSGTLQRAASDWTRASPADREQLLVRTTGQTLSALTLLGHKLLTEPQDNPRRIALLHTLLDEWIELAEWLLQRDRSPPGRWH